MIMASRAHKLRSERRTCLAELDMVQRELAGDGQQPPKGDPVLQAELTALQAALQEVEQTLRLQVRFSPTALWI